MILVVDNYDSFTYNLVDIVAQHTDVIVQYPDDDNVLNQSRWTLLLYLLVQGIH